MAAALRYRRLYWLLQQRQPAQLPPHRPCRAAGTHGEPAQGAQGTRPWASLGCGSSPWAQGGTSAPLNTDQELLLMECCRL